MWDPTTNKIHTSWDVVWLKRMYFMRQPTMLEITSGVPSRVRESESNLTAVQNVTTNITPIVNISPER